MWGRLDESEREARRALVGLIAAGSAPDAGSLAEVLRASPAVAGRVLEALVAKGFAVRGDAGGAIVAAYPLSVRPTRHRVTLGAGHTVHALCAMDALGVAPLFQTTAVVESRCPHCEGPIRLEVRDGAVRGGPPTAVLWYSMAELLEKRVEGLDLSAEH